MLKQVTRATLMLRVGGWMFTCLPRKHMNEEIHGRIRPFHVGSLACWLDRSDDGSAEFAA